MAVGTRGRPVGTSAGDGAWAVGALLGIAGALAAIAALSHPGPALLLATGGACAAAALLPLSGNRSSEQGRRVRPRRRRRRRRRRVPVPAGALAHDSAPEPLPDDGPTVRKLERSEHRPVPEHARVEAAPPAPPAQPAAPAEVSAPPEPAAPPESSTPSSPEVVAVPSDDREDNYLRGCRLQSAGDVGQAEGAFRQAAHAGHRLAWLALGQLLQARGELSEAIEAFRAAADGHDSLAATACLSLGVLLDSCGDGAGAATAYRRATEAGGPAGESAALLLRWLEDREQRAAA